MKGYTVALEGSTYRGSVALLRGPDVIAERTLGGESGGIERSGRGEHLMPAIADCLRETSIATKEIARVVCGAGPGSFTSLRVAGSVAKGLAVGWGVELFGVSSLTLIVAGLNGRLDPGIYLALLPAMREEFFSQRVEVGEDGQVQALEGAAILDAATLAEARRAESALRFIGPGQPVDAFPHARGVARMLDDIVAAECVDIASWEPDYGRLAEAQVRWEAEHGRPLPR
jgi:tRNA threonylcarbamoyladenosine biosynthesis protein TsaB